MVTETHETSEEWFRNAEFRIPIDLSIAHREWQCLPYHEDDGDEWSTPGWYAINRMTGERRCINHSRFAFQMTQERFRWLVEHNFPRSPGKGPWTNETIDSAMEEEA